MIKILFSIKTNMPSLQSGHWCLLARQKAIATNIAKYRHSRISSQEVELWGQIKEQMGQHLVGRRTNDKHMPPGEITGQRFNRDDEDMSEELHSGVNKC